MIERLAGWRVPEYILNHSDVVLYGEPLFAAVVAASLNRTLLEPLFDWLTGIPARYTNRAIQFTTLRAARIFGSPAVPHFSSPPTTNAFLRRSIVRDWSCLAQTYYRKIHPIFKARNLCRVASGCETALSYCVGSSERRPNARPFGGRRMPKVGDTVVPDVFDRKSSTTAWL